MISKYNGEIVGIGVAYPFVGDRLYNIGGGVTALLIVCVLARFCVCSILENILAQTTTSTLMNDWARFIGKPRLDVMDNGSPGMTGPAWDRLSHVYGWKLTSVPPRTPHQNGLVERCMRSIKIAAQSIMTDEAVKPTQDVLTMATIARNHPPPPPAI